MSSNTPLRQRGENRCRDPLTDAKLILRHHFGKKVHSLNRYRSSLTALLVQVSARDSYKKHLVIANIDPVMKPPAPRMPHVIPIPGLFVKDPQPLNDEFASFIENAEHGVIVSMTKLYL